MRRERSERETVQQLEEIWSIRKKNSSGELGTASRAEGSNVREEGAGGRC